MDATLLEDFIFIGIPREVSRVSGIDPGTVVNCIADKGILVLEKDKDSPSDEVCICPECLAKMMAESEGDNE